MLQSYRNVIQLVKLIYPSILLATVVYAEISRQPRGGSETALSLQIMLHGVIFVFYECFVFSIVHLWCIFVYFRQ